MVAVPEAAGGPLNVQLRRAIASAGVAGKRVAVALSGGLDSVVLLHALQGARETSGIALAALHVHHGLSPNADAWTEFCEDLCRRWAVPCRVERVHVARDDARGIEAAARAERYRCYGSFDVDVVALAHHADDQAETLLLQLLRGAGVGGLAAMPELRRLEAGQWLWRPFLALPRSVLREHARDADLTWVEDESNADADYPRNFLRAEILPRLEARFPAYRRTFARAAANAADADALARRVAEADLTACGDGDGLRVAALLALDPLRQANAVRHWLKVAGVRAPSREALSGYLAQIASAPSGAQPVLDIGDVRVASERGLLRQMSRAVPDAGWSFRWRGEREVALPDGRRMTFAPALGAGLRVEALAGREVVIAHRRGGERLRIARDRPTRTLKNLFQEHEIPPSERVRAPLVFVDGRLVFVPRVGLDPDFAAGEGQPGVVPRLERLSPVSRSPGDSQSD